MMRLDEQKLIVAGKESEKSLPFPDFGGFNISKGLTHLKP